MEFLPTNQLQPHPKNPRLVMRQDVIDGIAAQIEQAGGQFDPANALLVRPVNGHYQIVEGHHRYRAAQQLNLESIPCWVREMTDDEAYMRLALGNVQGELSPLEIGMHALGFVDTSNGGRGVKGGLSEYARLLGRTQQYVTQVRQAAEVLDSSKPTSQLVGFLDKAQHLAAIHKAPAELWPILVEWLTTPKDSDKPDSTPSANQAVDMVKAVNKFEIPEKWQKVFLSLPDVVSSFLKNKRPSPDEVTKLVNTAENLEQLIANCSTNIDSSLFKYSVNGFRDWLAAGVGLYAWDMHELTKYRQAVIFAAQEAAKPPEPDPKPGEWWHLGDHRLYCGDTSQPEFWQSLPDVGFAFADPPYNAGVAEWDNDFIWGHDWLMDKAEIVAVTPGIESIADFFRSATDMVYTWSMAAWIKNGMTRGKLGFGNWVYIALFSELESIYKNSQDVIEVTVKTGQTKETDHKGRKPQELLDKLLGLFTSPGDTVIDPFLGSGTTLFSAQQTGRICIGGELNPDYCKDIIARWQEATGQTAKVKK